MYREKYGEDFKLAPSGSSSKKGSDSKPKKGNLVSLIKQKLFRK
jgi:hypothetical protein